MRTSTRSLLLLIAVLCVSDVVVGSFFKQVNKHHCTDDDLCLAVITSSLIGCAYAFALLASTCL